MISRRTMLNTTGIALLLVGITAVTAETNNPASRKVADSISPETKQRLIDAGLPADSPALVSSASEQRDMDGNIISSADTPSAAELEDFDITPSTDRFIVRSVGLDVAVDDMTIKPGADITPPGFKKAYHIRGRNMVVMHSVHTGNAPGNPLRKSSPGDTIETLGALWRIDSIENVAKPDLPHMRDIWTDQPDRLVVITCLQRAQGRSTHNIVITATRIDTTTTDRAA